MSLSLHGEHRHRIRELLADIDAVEWVLDLIDEDTEDEDPRTVLCDLRESLTIQVYQVMVPPREETYFDPDQDDDEVDEAGDDEGLQDEEGDYEEEEGFSD